MTDPSLDEDDATTCATCGDPIAASPGRRIVTWVDGGEVGHRHFCGADCLDEWDG